MTTIEIKQTKDYSKFNILPFNRAISNANINCLIESIENDTMLHAHPILVDGDMNVIDGQHRLEVAKRLSLPIYYRIVENVSPEHLMHCNRAQKSWNSTDYIRFYAIYMKNPHYIRALQLIERTGLSIRPMMALTNGFVTGDRTGNIYKGNLKFRAPVEVQEKNLELYEEMTTTAKNLGLPIPTPIFKSYSSLKTLFYIFTHPSYDHGRMLDALRAHWFLLRPQASPDEWKQMWLSFYNYRLRSKSNIISFSDEEIEQDNDQLQ